MRWDGSGDQVDLKIYQGKNMVVSVPARMVKLERRTPADSTILNTNADGSYSLSQIRFGNKDYAIEIANDAGGSSSGAGASR